MVLLIVFLILFLFLVAVAAGMVIVLRERMAVEERLDRYCRQEA